MDAQEPFARRDRLRRRKQQGNEEGGFHRISKLTETTEVMSFSIDEVSLMP